MADISFVQYDSAVFPTIEQSIEHSKLNPFIFNNFSNRLLTLRDGQNTVVYEPYNVMRSLSWMLEPFLVEYDMPVAEHYMPELTAKNTYDSHDFWYVCMIVNNCRSVKEYQFKRYKILPATELYRIETFLDRVKGSLRVYDPEKDVIFK